jgi:hypothetical protein
MDHDENPGKFSSLSFFEAWCAMRMQLVADHAKPFLAATPCYPTQSTIPNSTSELVLRTGMQFTRPTILSVTSLFLRWKARCELCLLVQTLFSAFSFFLATSSTSLPAHCSNPFATSRALYLETSSYS